MTINKKKKKAARMTRITINLKGIQAILQEKKIKGERLHKLIDLNAALFFFFLTTKHGMPSDDVENHTLYMYTLLHLYVACLYEMNICVAFFQFLYRG